jgi:hypothetical protein
MDLSRVQDYLARLQDAAHKVHQSGDYNKADEFAKLIDEAETRLSPHLHQMKANLDAKGATPSGMMPVTTGNQNPMQFNSPAPSPVPTGQPGRDAWYAAGPGGDQPPPTNNANVPAPQQVQGTPMFDYSKLSGTPPSGQLTMPASSPFQAQPANPIDKAINAYPSAGPALTTGGGNSSLASDAKNETAPNASWADWLFTPVQGDKPVYPSDVVRAAGDVTGSDVVNGLKGLGGIRPSDVGNAVKTVGPGLVSAAVGPWSLYSTIAGNVAKDKPIKDWLDSTPPAPAAPKAAAAKPAEKDLIGVEGPVGASPENIKYNDPEMEDTRPAVRKMERDELYKELIGDNGKKPKSIIDLFGILFGGRNYLDYMSKEDEKSSDMEAKARAETAAEMRQREMQEEMLKERRQGLGIELLKAQQAAQKAKSDNENAELDSILRGSMQPGVDLTNPFIAEQLKRAKAIQSKRNTE